MKLKILGLFLFTAFLNLSLANSAESPSWIDRVQFTQPQIEKLDNGLTLAWFVDEKFPTADAMLLVQNGYRSDPVGKSGTAQLVGAMLDEGAAGKTGQEIAETVEALGASRFVTADDDTFGVGVHGLATDFPTLLKVMGDIALKPDFPKKDFLREKGQLLDRWSHIGDYSQTLAAIVFHRVLTAGTPYARGGMVSAREVKKIERQDLVDFHKKYFVPEKSVLMLVGRLDQKKTRRQIKEIFGSWSGKYQERSNKGFTPLKLNQAKRYLIGRQGLTQAQVRLGFEAPSIKSKDHYDLYVLNALLGGYFYSRLNSEIRDKLGLTYGIRSSFSYHLDFATFSINSSTRNEAVGQLVSKVLDIVKELKTKPVDAVELKKAKDYLIGSYPLSMSSTKAVASRWLAGYVYDFGPSYMNEFIPKVNQVTVKSINAAVKKHFDVSKLNIVVAGDVKQVQKSLNQAGLKNFKRLTVRDVR